MKYIVILISLLFLGSAFAEDYTCGDRIAVKEKISGSIKMEFIDSSMSDKTQGTIGVYRISNNGTTPIHISAFKDAFDISHYKIDHARDWYYLRFNMLWDLDLTAQQNGWTDILVRGTTGFNNPKVTTINPNEHYDFLGGEPPSITYEHHAYRVYYLTEEGYFILSEPYCLIK
jgi:hypothetical protein